MKIKHKKTVTLGDKSIETETQVTPGHSPEWLGEIRKRCEEAGERACRVAVGENAAPEFTPADRKAVIDFRVALAEMGVKTRHLDDVCFMPLLDLLNRKTDSIEAPVSATFARNLIETAESARSDMLRMQTDLLAYAIKVEDSE